MVATLHCNPLSLSCSYLLFRPSRFCSVRRGVFALSLVCLEQLRKEVATSRFVSLIWDESTDNSTEKLMLIYARYCRSVLVALPHSPRIEKT